MVVARARALVISVGCALSAARAARADATVDPCACSPNKPGFHRASALTGDWGGLRSELFDDGIKLQAVYAGELFAAPGLDADPAVIAGLATLGLDLELGTLIAPRLGAIHATALGIHGHGLTEQLMDVYGVSNNVAPADVRLFEAWYEQPLGPAAVRAGLLAADQEFTLASHGSVLLNATFGIVGMFSYNLGAPVYPIATPGVSARLETSRWTARAAVYDGDQPNRHGLPTGLGDHALAIAEVELDATLKLGAWHHTRGDDGYYAIVDRQLARRLGAFARAAIAPDQPIALYVDAGLRIGPGPWRPSDFASAGLVFARTERGAQTVAELTYQVLVTGWLTVQPDVQLVLARDRTAGVVATRAVVAF